ncbi:transcriptional regulator, TetR family [Desulfatibacillum alkenivorans DSM 16219]|jgi:AcrR family transcriptional regulator|uniref:Transcriptional regulator, TetR family n=1 Tax=Desulfatibacillum alkenivorans DSM 16219 TaxID=1121393 RepID=A0A1M6CPQ4_9BACT|nr:TetR/AcrR family transcriptional regulator [Desulfatibacillum alkenivorans]SHI63007.1 transcriptional regulator, TetR family [Desulfatibacillum alkenivorans DSM 16219]
MNEKTEHSAAAPGGKGSIKRKIGRAKGKPPSAAKGLSPKKRKAAAKGEVAREKILKAARTVFSKHPYHAASIRMIAREGGFDHPLIHYYFPTKADLFGEVAREMFEEFKETRDWLAEGLEKVDPLEITGVFIGRALTRAFANLEPLGVLTQNLAQTSNIEEIPGYHYIPEVFGMVRKSFVEKFPAWISEKEADQLIYSFTSLLFMYVGTSCQAQVMRMDFHSFEYREWVEETLVGMFRPHVEKALAMGRGKIQPEI